MDADHDTAVVEWHTVGSGDAAEVGFASVFERPTKEVAAYARWMGMRRKVEVGVSFL